MPVTNNKLIPIVGIVALAIVGTVLYQQFSNDGSMKPADDMKAVPTPTAQNLPVPRGADNDNASETLTQVVASNATLRNDVQRVIEQNNKLQAENLRLRGGGPGTTVSGENKVDFNNAAPDPNAPASSPVATPVSPTATPPEGKDAMAKVNEPTSVEAVGDAVSKASDTVKSVMDAFDGTGKARPVDKKAARSGQAPTAEARHAETDHSAYQAPAPNGAIAYKIMAPLGFAAVTEEVRGQGAQRSTVQTRYVRTTAALPAAGTASIGPATQAALAAAKPDNIPYFTIPENSTLVGVEAMTSLIGRVPIDGRVTDPMQFKAIVGRENLAANGWELPDDIAGMILTGIAIGDMALSCTEGKIRSVTFIFNDGTIRTVSNRSRSTAGAAGSGSSGSAGNGDLGFISDLHGNPCIMGKFVTNAPRFLADIVGLKTLGVMGAAYADAQRTVTQSAEGNTSSAVTGDRNKFVMGQAAAGATDEVTQWMLSRLKNSFDAVISPSGQQLVVHIDQEIQLDKAVKARKVVFRNQSNTRTQNGARYGLE